MYPLSILIIGRIFMDLNPEVAKQIEEIRQDRIHGASWLSKQAIGVLNLAAKKSEAARNARQRLEEQGIYVKSETREGIAEEIPEAYKNVDEVIEVVHQAGISHKVARLRPIGVIKG